MKITCEYCSSMYDDNQECCPFCGAKTPARAPQMLENPRTIEELKLWYEQRKLPPYETTRFFIGMDYRGSKAFGIYKDPGTGNTVVYKNKDDGSRAVRYNGSDEAYGVNEILMKLKEEITKRKLAPSGVADNSYVVGSVPNAKGNPVLAHNVTPVTPTVENYHPVENLTYGQNSNIHRATSRRGKINGYIIFALLIPVFVFVFTAGVCVCGGLANGDRGIVQPDGGYYLYNGTYAYYDASGRNWAYYSNTEGDWFPLDVDSFNNSELSEKKTAQKYYIGEWDNGFGIPTLESSQTYSDMLNGYEVDQGYYSYGDDVFYHLEENQDEGWYTYDSGSNGWILIGDDEIPSDLTHQSTAEDFYYTPTWDSSTQFSDFEDTDEYSDYHGGSSSYDDDDYSYDDDDYDYSYDDDDYDWGGSDYDWGGGSDWDFGGSDWGSDW